MKGRDTRHCGFEVSASRRKTGWNRLTFVLREKRDNMRFQGSSRHKTSWNWLLFFLREKMLREKQENKQIPGEAVRRKLTGSKRSAEK